MTQNSKSKWKSMQHFLEEYMQENTSYHVGAIYQAYLDRDGLVDISRHDFEMFLRYQVIKNDGMLKRVSHGIYEIRTNPNDRGILYTRSSAKKTEISLDEILDDSMELTSKINTMFKWLNCQENISFQAQMELQRLKSSLVRSMSAAVTGITAVMEWQENNMDMDTQDEPVAMEMGGL